MNPKSELHLAIGPLNYRFVAYDEWGKALLALLRENLDCRDFDREPRRTVHLLEMPTIAGETWWIREHVLPEMLAAVAGSPVPSSGWKRRGDECGFVSWRHPATDEAFWTLGPDSPHFEAVYQLP